MTVIFQVENLGELEEISQWLAKREIVIQKAPLDKVDVEGFLKRLRRYRIHLPANYRFNRDEANER
jgi:hypothetical protein